MKVILILYSFSDCNYIFFFFRNLDCAVKLNESNTNSNIVSFNHCKIIKYILQILEILIVLFSLIKVILIL